MVNTLSPSEWELTADDTDNTEANSMQNFNRCFRAHPVREHTLGRKFALSASSAKSVVPPAFLGLH